jgi:altronate dehydratase
VKVNALIIHARDNVVVALEEIKAGDKVTAKGTEAFEAVDDIPISHKIALCDIQPGEEVIKYGETVAVSTQMIKKGQWVHIHNVESRRWKK